MTGGNKKSTRYKQIAQEMIQIHIEGQKREMWKNGVLIGNNW